MTSREEAGNGRKLQGRAAFASGWCPLNVASWPSWNVTAMRFVNLATTKVVRHLFIQSNGGEQASSDDYKVAMLL